MFTRILLEIRQPWSISDFNKSSLLSNLHCASFFEIDEIIAGLVKVEDCEVNKRDCMGNTSLTWDARGGHEGLLGRGDVNPDKRNNDGETSLHGFYSIFTTLVYAKNKPCRSRTNPNTRVLGLMSQYRDIQG